MNCLTCQNNLVAYLEEKLPVEIQRNTAAHLESCNQCRELYNEMKLVYNLIEDEKAIVSNPFLVTRVMTAIENQETALNKEPVHKRIMQTALIAASISIAVLGGIEAGNLYTTAPEKKAIPDEMVFMNDTALESLNIYTTE